MPSFLCSQVEVARLKPEKLDQPKMGALWSKPKFPPLHQLDALTIVSWHFSPRFFMAFRFSRS